MDQIEKYYTYRVTDSEMNFRDICGMNDDDPKLKKKDIERNLDLLIKTAFSFIETAKNEREREEYENAVFSCLGDWILRLKVKISNYVKNMIIDKAILKHYIIGNNYELKFSIGQLMGCYYNGILYWFKDYKQVVFVCYEAEKALRIAINKYNYKSHRPIPKLTFERNLYKMLKGRLDDECLMVLSVLLLKCGAKMDMTCFNLISNEIEKKRDEKCFDDYENTVTKYYLNSFII